MTHPTLYVRVQLDDGTIKDHPLIAGEPIAISGTFVAAVWKERPEPGYPPGYVPYGGWDGVWDDDGYSLP